MSLAMRRFTQKDLKYYYFYYRIGCAQKKCRCRGLNQETKIFCHLLDNEIIAQAERILRRKMKEFRFQNYEHANRVHCAALHYFNPDTHKVGRLITNWDREQIEQLAPIKRCSKIIWYFVFGDVIWRGEKGELTDRTFRSKSFPASSPEEAERKARRWLKNFERRLKKGERISEPSLYYANRNRGCFSLPGTESSLLNPS